MPLFAPALDTAGEAICAAITHVQFHSDAPGGAGTANVITGGRFPINLDSTDGNISLASPVAATGLTAESPVWGVTFWTAATGGTAYGSAQRSSGDANVNAAGEYSLTGVSIPASSS
jgi:hypothetical protein